MSRRGETTKHVVAALIVCAVAFFFYRAFRGNWAAIRSQEFRADPPFLVAALLCVVAMYWLSTYGWHLTVNTLSKRPPLPFSHSVAAVNIAGLTKYIPGKLWSYALQMYWLAGAGISKSLIVYVNVVSILISTVTSLILGFACLLFVAGPFPKALVALALAALLVLDFLSLAFHAPALNRLIALVNRLFRRDIQYFDVPAKLLAELHLLYLLAALLSSGAVCLVALGVGYPIALAAVPLVMASSLLSDVIGYLAIVVPGGLGVREGVMYLVLGGAGRSALALILPLVSRCLNMLVDVAFGTLALKLLKNLSRR